MSTHRFRFSKDFDVEASSMEEARQVLEQICDENNIVELKQALEQGAFEYLGDAEVRDICAEDRKHAEPLVQPGFLLMSCQFRGENFIAICSSRDVAGEKVAVRPLALVLREEHLDHLTDPIGGKPVEIKE